MHHQILELVVLQEFTVADDDLEGGADHRELFVTRACGHVLRAELRALLLQVITHISPNIHN